MESRVRCDAGIVFGDLRGYMRTNVKTNGGSRLRRPTFGWKVALHTCLELINETEVIVIGGDSWSYPKKDSESVIVDTVSLYYKPKLPILRLLVASQSLRFLAVQFHQQVDCKYLSHVKVEILSDDSKFVTGSKNGTVTLWKQKKIEKSTKLFDEWTLVLFKSDHIFAAAQNNVVELNMTLEVVKTFSGRNAQPFTIDANERYLVVGYKCVEFIGQVDVHSRKELEQDGKYRKILVSCTDQISFNIKYIRNTNTRTMFFVSLSSKMLYFLLIRFQSQSMVDSRQSTQLE